MPLDKGILPALASCGVGGVVSYGCYIHMSNASLGNSSAKNNLPIVGINERPSVTGEKELQPTVRTDNATGK